MLSNPKTWTFISAEIIFLLTRSRDIITVSKSKNQRLKDEQNKIDRGLRRSLFLEAFLFVPSSALLIILIAPMLVPDSWFEDNKIKALYSILGVISYGFPFVTIKRMITRLALKTLLEFASLAPDETKGISKDERGGGL